MSTAELTCAGSRLVTSLLKPKRNVWSAARVSDDPPPPPPQAATTDNAPNAAARERNLELPVIQPPQETKPRKALSSGAILDIHRPLPGGPGRECAGNGFRHLAMAPLTPWSSWGLDPCRVKLPGGSGGLAPLPGSPGVAVSVCEHGRAGQTEAGRRRKGDRGDPVHGRYRAGGPASRPAGFEPSGERPHPQHRHRCRALCAGRVRSVHPR